MLQKPSPSEIDADRAALKAIEGLVDYQSVNPAYSTSALQQLNAALMAAQDATERTRLAYEHAREIEADTARRLHMCVRMAKSQVYAQFGDDSYAVQSIGWTRRSARKRPVRKASVK